MPIYSLQDLSFHVYEDSCTQDQFLDCESTFNTLQTYSSSPAKKKEIEAESTHNDKSYEQKLKNLTLVKKASFILRLYRGTDLHFLFQSDQDIYIILLQCK